MKQTDKQKNAMLGELFEQFHGVILRAIVGTLGADYSYLAEDCLSQTFLIACQKKDDLLSRQTPVVWLIATGKNCARNAMRGVIKEQSFAAPLDTETEHADANSDAFVEQIAYDDWVERDVAQKLIDGLNPRVRRAFVAKYREGKSNAKIAEEMQISESTVRTFLHDAKRQIEQKIRSGEF